MALKRPVYLCSVALARSEEWAFVVHCSDVTVKAGPGLGSISMQIVRDARIHTRPRIKETCRAINLWL